MVKSLFLEFKFGDYDLEKLSNSGANHLIVVFEKLTTKRREDLSGVGANLAISFSAVNNGFCPADPATLTKLLASLKDAIEMSPSQIWLDQLRFNGRWENGEGNGENEIHRDCKYCSGKDRKRIIEDLAEQVRRATPSSIELGYFAVPFYPDESNGLLNDLGQDHGRLSKYFDYVSPMLYHRMLGKDVSYISEYSKWLMTVTNISVFPIIQVKDMPDYLENRLESGEMEEMYSEAIKLPIAGLCWFSWDAAIEKDKTDIIKEMFDKN